MRVNPVEDRAYAECQTCSWACSGAASKMDNKADQHKFNNQGHKVKMNYVEPKDET